MMPLVTSVSENETKCVNAIAIIPARLASTRLPRKVLREIAGRPMLAWVYAAARGCSRLQDVIVATDSEEIAEVCRQNGWNYRMTSPEHRSGTDRVNEVAQTVAADVYVNVQGDEPLARREHLDVLLTLMERDDVAVGTLKTPCSAEDVDNPNAVKVVTALDGRALYFSRATIPFDRDRNGAVRRYKHLGFYAYRKAALDAFCRLAGVGAGAQRAAGAATVSGERHRDPRRRDAVRHRGSGYGRGFAEGGTHLERIHGTLGAPRIGSVQRGAPFVVA